MTNRCLMKESTSLVCGRGTSFTFRVSIRTRHSSSRSDMHRYILVVTTASLLVFSASTADAGVKTRTLTGAAIGAGAGAVVAGPPGAVVGGVAGAYIGGPNLPPRRKCWRRHGVRHCR